MTTGLAGRVALISGASQGIGRAIAQAFAAEGTHVALCARQLDALQALADDLRAHSSIQVYTAAVDVTDSGALTRFVEHASRELGAIDICVSNAGGPPAKSFLDTTDDDWQHAFDANLRSTVTLARAILPGMQQRHWGRIVAITSLCVRQPIPQLVLSNTIRTGVLGLIRTLSNEFAKDGITVNNVAPGYTATDRLQDLARHLAAQGQLSVAQVQAEWTAQIPVGRLARPEEIADAVVWLASERATYITGQTLVVDGGVYKGV